MLQTSIARPEDRDASQSARALQDRSDDPLPEWPFGTDVTAFALYAYNFPYDFCFRYRRVGRRQRVPSCNQMIICDAHYAVHCELLLLSE